VALKVACCAACLVLQVTSLSLGKGRQQRDRIFYAAGNMVSVVLA